MPFGKMKSIVSLVREWDALTAEISPTISALQNLLEQWDAATREEAYRAFSFVVSEELKENLRSKISSNILCELRSLEACVDRLDDVSCRIDALARDEIGNEDVYLVNR